MLIGAAKVIAAKRAGLRGHVVLLFQPAEERYVCTWTRMHKLVSRSPTHVARSPLTHARPQMKLSLYITVWT
jgi:hypothetical protein